MVTDDLPEDVSHALIARYSEPHRDYHGVRHLEFGLERLAELGAGPIERIAYWFHDAVHSNSTPDDERASAEVAREMLRDHLTIRELNEVVRLVLLTITHQPEPGDESGAMVSDADLAGLALDWASYSRNVEGIRFELPDVTDEQWRIGRAQVLRSLLDGEHLFHTEHGRTHWEAAARANMQRELDEL